ncbi:DUF1523 family protein [Rhodobacter maris]|uniref:Uncharacterized protein DUF1523 n=1 Tax=Rhodobacter maris TaxID=446682 RepID=A0A285RIW7_9RHOB|nr:DUF1523 family protein [Rhodobacter maris]SOB94075.1 uncharacterized protein DUF1523 [Rhodobacter maris]
MTYVKWTFWALLTVFVGAFLHYTLPQHDVVRVVNTYQERQDLGDWTRIFWSSPEDQSGNLSNRDVQFISAVTADGKPVVYRNEDTGWGWPPYFKFDTANLLTEAEDLKSTAEAPKWAVITHYGWRSEILSIFPNAVAIHAVDDKDVTVIPWFNIVFLTLFVMLVLTVRALWIQFRRRSIDPVLEDVADVIEDVTDKAEEYGDRARNKLDDLTGKR